MVQINTLVVISSVQERISCKQSLEKEYQGTENHKQKATQFRKRKTQKIGKKWNVYVWYPFQLLSKSVHYNFPHLDIYYDEDDYYYC